MILIWVLSLSVISCRKYWFGGQEYLCKNSSSLGLIQILIHGITGVGEWWRVFLHTILRLYFLMYIFLFLLDFTQTRLLCALHLHWHTMCSSHRPVDVPKQGRSCPGCPLSQAVFTVQHTDVFCSYQEDLQTELEKYLWWTRKTLVVQSDRWMVAFLFSIMLCYSRLFSWDRRDFLYENHFLARVAERSVAI